MLDDLIFKGKSLDEALSKASNFFGADKGKLNYEELDEAPQGEYWIKLKEHPRADDHEDLTDEQPQFDPQMERLGMGKVRGPVLRRGRLPRSVDSETGSRRETRPPQPEQRSERAPRDQQQRGPRPKQEHRPQRAQRGERSDRGERRGRGERGDRRPAGERRRQGGRDRSEAVNREYKESKAPDWLEGPELDAFNLVVEIVKKMRLRLDISAVKDESRIVFNLDGIDRSILVAKKGSLIIAIQYLISKIYFSKRDKPQKIFIDSQGYRVAREEELKEIALLSAQKVRSSRKEYVLNPMNPYERRLIHLALKDFEDVTTVSRGNGFIKQVSIVPK